MTHPRSITLHRIFKAPPERVYRAFLEADALAKWLPPYGFACTVHELDARVGGRHRMSFRNFTTSASHAFGGEYRELVPFERLSYTDRFDDPNMPGEMTVTVTLSAVQGGTALHVLQSGIPEPVPLEMCHLGWQESLVQLAQLVEPDLGEPGGA